MKNNLFKALSLNIALLVACMGLFGCTGNGNKKQKLATPEVVISYDGVAVWSSLEGALYYVYVIDDGEEMTTAECRVVLSDNQSIKVKAVSASDDYSDSDFSITQKYIKDDNSAAHDHSDVNADGVCDLCGESVIAELSFYAINDLHGKFIDTSTQPGLDEFTTYMKSLYADGAREEILLSSGDMWQGTVESSSNKGALMTEWMNDVGFSALTLGNHEYDWGADTLKPNSELAEFPFLAINVTKDGNTVDYCQASTVVERGGVKVGIIGAIGDCLSSISGDFTSGLNFATDSALTSLVRTEARRLRNEEGCDFIVYSIHDGTGSSSTGITSVKNSDLEYYDTSLSNGDVDLVFEAHTHKSYILRDEYGVYHMQAGSENSYMSCAEVSINTITNEYTVSPKLISNKIYASDSLADDPIVDEIFDKYFPDDDPYTTVLGGNSSRRGESAILNTVARLYYEKGVEVWGDKYDIVLGGGYLNVRNPYYVSAGNVTYADLFSVLPFDNKLVLGRVKGSKLKSRFLNNNSYYVYSPSTIDTSSVSDNKDYYIIVDSYSSTYKYNGITEIERLNEEIYARDLLADYVRAGGWGTAGKVTTKLGGAYFSVSAVA